MEVEWRRGRVISVEPWSQGCSLCQVEISGASELALAYHDLVGRPEAGDRVWLNTTAVTLGLGTGGHHLVAWTESGSENRLDGPGHLMKLRYTPLQGRVLAAEEPDSPWRRPFEEAFDLGGRPVLNLSLHSQLAPVCLAAHLLTGGAARVTFVMTDGAALPLPLSRLAGRLKAEGWLDRTVTTGHAFGGDLETITLHSGLQAAARVCRADFIVAGPGPGTAGTGTALGHTGLEQGETVNAAAALGGRPVAIPRLSFQDSRPSHYGVSHHSLTALGVVALAPALIAVPELEPWQLSLVLQQLGQARGMERHQLYLVGSGLPLRETIEKLDEIGWRTMGRRAADVPEAVSACLAAVAVALWVEGSGAGHMTCPGGI